MTSQKKRHRARRRVERILDDAHEALAKGERALAEKLSQRAVDAGHVNPRVWLERGRIARELGDLEEADAAFRQAIARAATFGEAFAELARLQAARGKPVAAARLMRRAAELTHDNVDLRRSLESELEQFGPAAEAEEPGVPLPEPPDGPRALLYDVTAIEAELRRKGVARIQRLLDRSECERLLDALREGDALGHGISHDGDEGRYTLWFIDRIPPLGESLVAELLACCAGLVESVFVPLGRKRPAAVTSCALVDQPADGFTRPTAPPDREAFPLRVDVALTGAGEVTVVDLRPGRKVRRQLVPFAAGDAVIACARERVVRVGGVDGLQPVAVGVSGEVMRLRVRFDLV